MSVYKASLLKFWIQDTFEAYGLKVVTEHRRIVYDHILYEMTVKMGFFFRRFSSWLNKKMTNEYALRPDRGLEPGA